MSVVINGQASATPNDFDVLEPATQTAPISFTTAYDTVDDMIKVKSMQKKFRDSFSGAAVNPAIWDVVVGAGMSAGVSGGVLTIGTGTTNGSETTLTSKEIFTIPCRVMVGLLLSQRIANQEFAIELISCDENGVLDNLHGSGWIFDGTSATQAKYYVRNGGLSALISSASTVATTASLSVFEVEPFQDEAWFHQRAIDSTAGRTASFVRHQQIPDPNRFYKLRIRARNTGTAASNTNLQLQYINCSDYAELTAEITAGRGNSVEGQAIAARVVNTITLAQSNVVIGKTSLNADSGTGGFGAPSRIVSAAAGTNGTIAKNTAGRFYKARAYNATAALRYLKIYNKATAPTVGTDKICFSRAYGHSLR